MSALIDQFCDEHHVYHDISEDRRRMQRKLLVEFEASVGRPLLELDAGDVQRFLAALIEGGQMPSTVGKKLNAIRPFYAWARQRKLIDAELLAEMRELTPPRGARTSRPNPYTRAEVRKLWAEVGEAYPWADPTMLKRWRNGHTRFGKIQTHAQRLQLEAIVALGVGGGLRRNEIYLADLDDIEPESDYVVVRGARKNPDAEERIRTVPMNGLMRPKLDAWLQFRAELDPPHDRPWLSLWHQHALKPLRHRKFEVLLSELGSGWRYHRLRHTFGTEQLRAGTELHVLQRMMGHTRIQQTLEYAELLDKDILLAASRSERRFVEAVAA